MSFLAAETAEIPAVIARQRGGLDLARLARLYAKDAPRVMVVCGRGSSGHAGVLLRYLAETRLALPVAASAPSVVTSLAGRLNLAGQWFVVISQSGGSPDLVAATAAARKDGARTIAIVNETASPVAAAAEIVLPMAAGPERSVAATKSVVASMAAAAELVAALAGDDELGLALGRLPGRLAEALELDWTALAESLAGALRARCMFVAARGFGLGPAREIALKMVETLRLPALAYSAAELMHGPRAAIGPDTPVLALRLPDDTAAAVDALVAALAGSGACVHVCGGPGTTLPWLADDHPVTDAIAMLPPAYRTIEAAARRLGLDPDRPPFLSKVTHTL